MSKSELIDAIRQVNRTVAPEFLAHFKEADLKAYLDRVCAVAHTHPSGIRPTIDARERLVIG